MANCQNNMRYGRQMNYSNNYNNNCNNSCNNSCNNNRNNMPANNNACRPEPIPAPRCEQPKPIQNNCGCHVPEPPKKECPPTPCCHVEHKIPECKIPKCEPTEPRKCPHDILDGLPIAMAYVPCQKWQNVCDPCKGFRKGTIFEDLCKPFLGKGGCNR